MTLRLNVTIPSLHQRCDKLRIDTEALLADFDLSDESTWHLTVAARKLAEVQQSLRFAEMMMHDE
jgi:hypothetical protein